jgi:hypothetical protein
MARVLTLLERLSNVLAAPAGVGAGRAAAENESGVCGLITSRRAGGATEPEIAARLPRLVKGASPEGTPARETAARVRAVAGWCARTGAARASAARAAGAGHEARESRRLVPA